MFRVSAESILNRERDELNRSISQVDVSRSRVLRVLMDDIRTDTTLPPTKERLTSIHTRAMQTLILTHPTEIDILGGAIDSYQRAVIMETDATVLCELCEHHLIPCPHADAEPRVTVTEEKTTFHVPQGQARPDLSSIASAPFSRFY